MELKITCALCAKLVDGWRVDTTVENRGWDVSVRCHGEEESCFISERDVMLAGPSQNWVEGVAFHEAPPPKPGRRHGRRAFLTDYDALPGDTPISFTRRAPFHRPLSATAKAMIEQARNSGPTSVEIKYLEPPQSDPDTRDMLDATQKFPEILARSFGMPITTVSESTPQMPEDLRNYQLAAYAAIWQAALGDDEDDK